MRPATVSSAWSLLKLKRATTSSGGARRWLLYTIVFMLLCYLVAAGWFAFRIFSPSAPSTTTSRPTNQRIVHLRDITELPGGGDEDDIHIVFSTGCNLFQHWQAEVLLYSHKKVGQPGKITRVVSGCDTEHEKREHANFLTHPEGLGDDAVSLDELKRSSNERLVLHVTPSFPGAREFPWINKPMGLAHWLEHANPQESVIVIIDPDQFFMDKLRLGREDNGLLCSLDCPKGKTQSDRVEAGRPVAQQYGLGGGMVHKHDVRKLAKLIGEDEASPLLKLTEREAAQHYSVGPPMIAHRDDFRKIFPLWVKFMDPVFQADPGDIQADMYAYSFAAAHHNLAHATYDHYMVSSPETEGEAWPNVGEEDLLKMKCSNPNANVKHPPTFLHVAQRYDSKLTAFMFHKGHVPANILSCAVPLLAQPPEDLVQQAPKHNKHKMYMLCNAYQLINEAALAWKQVFCGQGEFNANKAVMLQKHSQHCSKKEQGNKCWIFARVLDSLNE